LSVRTATRDKLVASLRERDIVLAFEP